MSDLHIKFYLNSSEKEQLHLLFCYRVYCSPSEFWKKLLPYKRHEHFHSMIKLWLSNDALSKDLADCNTLGKELIKLVKSQETGPEDDKNQCKLKCLRINSRPVETDLLSNSSSESEGEEVEVSISLDMKIYSANIFLSDHKELAEHLTWICYQKYKKVTVEEVVAKIIKKKSKACWTNLSDFTDFFNYIASVIATQLLCVNGRKRRLQVIHNLYRLMVSLRRLRNYHMLAAVFAGINDVSVQRLKDTWKKVKVRKFYPLESVIGNKSNYSCYRQTIQADIQNGNSYIPFGAVHEKTLVSIAENIPTTQDDSRASNTFIDKFGSEMYHFLGNSTNYAKPDNITKFEEALKLCAVIDEDTRYELSRSIEPGLGAVVVTSSDDSSSSSSLLANRSSSQDDLIKMHCYRNNQSRIREFGVMTNLAMTQLTQWTPNQVMTWADYVQLPQEIMKMLFCGLEQNNPITGVTLQRIDELVKDCCCSAASTKMLKEKTVALLNYFSVKFEETTQLSNEATEMKKIPIIWTPDDVGNWLKRIGLGDYSEKFIYHQITGEALIELEKDDLREIGVNIVGHRVLLQKHIQSICSIVSEYQHIYQTFIDCIVK